ncbi:hypothetical protein DDE82_003489 [Stemphylium lycopersici]|nr:hypothetical protein DDE82_003489 [Stemphylium lycopersici]
MTWWRRDPIIPPVQRYAQRLLRSHDAALRTRCFSRTPPKYAQREDDKDSKRPAGMSNPEWMQLQHYQRWRKKLVDDPYQAIFGASNDMLTGKGLKDWEWISKSFPKWMLREMDRHDQGTTRSKSDTNTNSQSKYPKKVDMQDVDADALQERQSHFPQPAFRAIRLDRDDSRGVVSPSDLRRPREQPHVKAVGDRMESTTELGPKADNSVFPSDATPTSEPPSLSQPKTTESFGDYIARTKSNATAEIEKSVNSVPANETFIDQFFSHQPQHEVPNVSTTFNTSSWKETALQRRSPRNGKARSEMDPVRPPKTSDDVTESRPITQNSEAITSSSTKEQSSPLPPVDDPPPPTHRKQEPSTTHEANAARDLVVPARSTSKILSQLPEDDIDFLSAADIRASMNAKRSKIFSGEQKKAQRDELEKTFIDAHLNKGGVDPMIESQVVNDQLIRRIERKMQQPEEPENLEEPQPTKESEDVSAPVTETQMESSIERMKSWLEQSGAMFANYFWQDPTEEADAQKTRLFFDKVLVRIRKARFTMKQVIEDLETDIPASKPLLERMKADEDLLDSAIHALRQRAVSGKMQPLTPKKVRAIQSLRLKFQDTDNDLTKAYAALQEIGNSVKAKNASLAFKRRLGIAAKITQKNAHLTRYLIWSLQARLEDPDIDRSMLANYKAVANSLLTLRDTQMAISRLVERAMLVYGVEPQTVENVDVMGQDSVKITSESGQPSQSVGTSSLIEVDKAQIRAKVAAEERLANEVDAQKSAMRGLSDDGYAGASKSEMRKAFEERSPLDHSLYRPFGPVLESLVSELPSRAEATKAEEEAAQQRSDAELVAEVKKAYEDTYGPITIGHRQLADAAEQVKAEQDNEVSKFEMLKEDPAVVEAAPAQFELSGMPETSVINGTAAVEAASQVIENDSAITQAAPSTATPSSPEALKTTPDSSDTTSTPPLTTNPQTYYTILLHDPETNTICQTHSTSPTPRDTSPSIPLHTALSTLSQPGKFFPFIRSGMEVVTAKPDMLILRNALDASSPSTAPAVPEAGKAEEAPVNADRHTINPIDGTTRLSPTGYVGPEETREQLEREFDERRQAAGRVFGGPSSVRECEGGVGRAGESKGNKGGKTRRGAGVVKTAIWAAAGCYVVGVLGEVVGSG